MFHVLRSNVYTWNRKLAFLYRKERGCRIACQRQELFLECKLKHSRLFNDRVEVVTDLVSDAVPETAEVETRKRQAQENHKRETGKLKTKRNGSSG